MCFIYVKYTENSKKKIRNEWNYFIKCIFGTSWLNVRIHVMSFMSKFFTINAKYVFGIKIEMSHDPDLLIHSLWKKEFRGNFGVILDFSGIPKKKKY